MGGEGRGGEGSGREGRGGEGSRGHIAWLGCFKEYQSHSK